MVTIIAMDTHLIYYIFLITIKHHIMMFQSTMYHIYNGGPTDYNGAELPRIYCNTVVQHITQVFVMMLV